MAQPIDLDQEIAIIEPIDLNKDIVISFTITASSAIISPVVSLSDDEFNPNGMGRVDITEQGFEITVRNTKTQTAARFFLKASELINFHCSKPVFGKIVNLTLIYQIVTDANHFDDTITISHIDGSDKLTFLLGGNPESQKDVPFIQLGIKIKRIPCIRTKSEAVFPCLNQMVKDLPEKTPKPELVSVSVLLPNTFMEAKIPAIGWKYRNPRVEITAPGKSYQAHFMFYHLVAMRKALAMRPPCHICYLVKPAKSVMIRLSLKDLGDFALIYKPLRKKSFNLRRADTEE